MATINRKDVRQMVTTLLKGAVQGTVESYQTDPAGRSPLVQVVSAGTFRNDIRRLGAAGQVMLSAHCFVIHFDEKSSWTEEMAEDEIDDLEFQIAESFASNQNTELWMAINWEMPSLVDRVTIGGVPYLYEVIPLVVEVK